MRVEVRFFQKGRRNLYNEEQVMEYHDVISATVYDNRTAEVVFYENGRQLVDCYEWVTGFYYFPDTE